jgi:uncharacterized protein (DUF885 family)
MKWSIALLGLAILICGPVRGQDSAGARLNSIFADYWEWHSIQLPEDATFRGDNRFNDRLTDASPEAVASRKAYRAALSTRLGSIDRSRLVGQDRISYDVLRRQLASAARLDAIYGKLPFGYEDDTWAPVTQFDGPQFGLPLLAQSTPFTAVADYEAYLKRLAQIPGQLRQYQQRMQVGIDTGWLPPGVSLQRVPSQLDAHLNPDVTQLPLYRPFANFPADVPAPERKRLSDAGDGPCTPRAWATRWASTRTRIPSSASCPTRCGAPAGWWSTPECTRSAGAASAPSPT